MFSSFIMKSKFKICKKKIFFNERMTSNALGEGCGV